MQIVLSNENMRKSDAEELKRTTSETLMYRAGKAVYNTVNWHFPVAIVCGSGNNAGDGYVLASLLKENNIECKLFLLYDKFSTSGKHYFDICLKNSVPYEKLDEKTEFNGYNTIVDCIFGTGFKDKVEGIAKLAIEKINSSDAYVVSVDINSGLNGDSGMCDTAVKSDLTVSIGNYKSGHFLNMAKDYIKSKINCDIGIKPIDRPYYLIEKNDLKQVFSARDNFSNKGTFGYIALICGSKKYSGAAKLANLSCVAMRAGSGVVKLAVPSTISGAIEPFLLESTLFPLSCLDTELTFNKGKIDELISNVSTVVFGMGIGTNKGAEDILKYLLKTYDKTLVIDADGLNILSKFSIDDIKNTNAKIVLTPHVKEFSRLTGLTIQEIFDNPIKHTENYAKKVGAIVLLKGATTIITNGETTYLVDKGCAGMATAGSGDVLSGIIGAVCGYYKQDLLLATAAGTYINGLSGEIAQEKVGDISMIASDTISAIPKAILSIRK